MAIQLQIRGHYFECFDNVTNETYIREPKVNVKFSFDDSTNVLSFFNNTPFTESIRNSQRLGTKNEFDYADLVDHTSNPFASVESLKDWLSSTISI